MEECKSIEVKHKSQRQMDQKPKLYNLSRTSNLKDSGITENRTPELFGLLKERKSSEAMNKSKMQIHQELQSWSRIQMSNSQAFRKI
jgi:hypothetical protein